MSSSSRVTAQALLQKRKSIYLSSTNHPVFCRHAADLIRVPGFRVALAYASLPGMMVETETQFSLPTLGPTRLN